MAKLTKRMRVIREKVDATKQYDINEAIALLKELATAKFVESVDVAVNLGIDARKSDQNVRGATVLPHGTGRSVRVAVFTQGANAEAAKAAGAELVGMEDLAEQIKKGEMNFALLLLLRMQCALLASWARFWVRAADAKPESGYCNAETLLKRLKTLKLARFVTVTTKTASSTPPSVK